MAGGFLGDLDDFLVYRMLVFGVKYIFEGVFRLLTFRAESGGLHSSIES